MRIGDDEINTQHTFVDGRETVVISDGEAKQIRANEERLVQMKCQLADTDLRLQEMAQQREQALTQLAVAQKEHVKYVHDMARRYGIDPNDNSKKWNFNTSTYTFTRLDRPQQPAGQETVP